MAFDLDDYTNVDTRRAAFFGKFPEGRLRPADPMHPIKIIELDGRYFLEYVACAFRTENDPSPGIGIAWEPFPGRTPYTRDSEAQNAETSAWGRAIKAAMDDPSGQGPSREEVRNRREEDQREDRPQFDQGDGQLPLRTQPPPRRVPNPPARAEALARLFRIANRLDPEASDQQRNEMIKNEMEWRGLDGGKTEDLIKLAEEWERTKV